MSASASALCIIVSKVVFIITDLRPLRLSRRCKSTELLWCQAPRNSAGVLWRASDEQGGTKICSACWQGQLQGRIPGVQAAGTYAQVQLTFELRILYPELNSSIEVFVLCLNLPNLLLKHKILSTGLYIYLHDCWQGRWSGTNRPTELFAGVVRWSLWGQQNHLPRLVKARFFFLWTYCKRLPWRPFEIWTRDQIWPQRHNILQIIFLMDYIWTSLQSRVFYFLGQ